MVVGSPGEASPRRTHRLASGARRGGLGAADCSRRAKCLSGVDVLGEIGKQGGVRTHRPAVLRACVRALQLCNGTEGRSMYDAAIRMREQNRLVGRPLPRRAVGSTLLLKGLEGDIAVVLNAVALRRSQPVCRDDSRLEKV